MGKKRIVKKKGASMNKELKKRSLARGSKRKLSTGILNVEATFNNTKVLFADTDGNTVFWSSTGALGFKGAKKGTPFAAAKVGDVIGEKSKMIGVKDVDVVVKGVGSGREPAIRAFMAHGIDINSIVDKTPIPHNGPRPPKPRRV